MKNILIAITLLTSLVLVLNGCGSSNSGPATAADVADTTVSELVEASEGGSLTYQVMDGTRVTLEIPPNALSESITTTLKVDAASDTELAGVDSLYVITVGPESVKLFNPAYLRVIPAPVIENVKNKGLFIVNDNNHLMPLKQVNDDNQVKGSIYMSGRYELSGIDTGKCIEILSDIEAADIPENWQDLISVFNGLIWTGTWFRNNNESDDAKACMDNAIDICSQGIEKFIARSLLNDDKALAEYKNSLEKYKYIQKLCADQEVLSKNLDGK